MDVSVADIVNVASKPNAHLIASEDIPCLWRGESGGTARLLAGTSGPDMIELWEWKMHNGEIFNSPGHSDGTCELIHVVRGSLLLTLGEERLTVNEGCSVIARTDLPHSYECVEGDLLEFTMTVSEQIR